MLPDYLTSYSSFRLEILSEGQLGSLLRDFTVPLGTVVPARNNIAGHLWVCEDTCPQHRGRRGWKWQPMAAEPQPLSPHADQRLPQEGESAPGSWGALRRRLDREDWVAVVRGNRRTRPLVEGNYQDVSNETTPVECDECFQEIREFLEDEVNPLERTKHLIERVVAVDTQGLLRSQEAVTLMRVFWGMLDPFIADVQEGCGLLERDRHHVARFWEMMRRASIGELMFSRVGEGTRASQDCAG